MDYRKIVAIFAHDAGGAELVSLWAKKYNYNYITVIEGPATKIFKQNSLKQVPYKLNEAIAKCDWIFCSTSWQSDLEKKAIIKAKEMGKKSISFLDHCINYRERFLYKGNLNLPDEIWVSDKYARKIIVDEFPEACIKLVENPYFENIKYQIDKIKSKKKDTSKTSSKNILFLAENFTQYALMKYGSISSISYTEYDAVKFFLENLHFLSQDITSIKIRPHPSEKKDKYDSVKKQYPNFNFIDAKHELIEDISNADIVAGCSTMGLAIACIAKKQVFSCIPLSGIKCPIPFKEIKDLRSLIKKNNLL